MLGIHRKIFSFSFVTQRQAWEKIWRATRNLNIFLEKEEGMYVSRLTQTNGLLHVILVPIT